MTQQIISGDLLPPWETIGRNLVKVLYPPNLIKRLAMTATSQTNAILYETLIGCGGFAARQLLTVGSNYIYERKLKNFISFLREPSIPMYQRCANRSLEPSLISRIFSSFFGIKQITKKETPLTLDNIDSSYNPSTREALNTLKQSVSVRVKEKKPLMNAIVYGPPGCGKSKALKELAVNQEVDYMAFSGSALRDQIRSGAALRELQKIVNKANRSKNMLIVIEECEQLFRSREYLTRHGLMQECDLLNAFLTALDDPNRKFGLICATNHYSWIDEAITSRMDFKIPIDLPEFNERCAIIKNHIASIFQQKEDLEIWGERQIEQLALQTPKFSGRDLQKLLERIELKRKIANVRLDIALILQTLEDVTRESFRAQMAGMNA